MSLSASPPHLKVGVNGTPVALSAGSFKEGLVTEIETLSVGESHPEIIKNSPRKKDSINNLYFIVIPHLICMPKYINLESKKKHNKSVGY